MPRAAAAPRPPRARSTDEKEGPWNDAFGILLLMLAAMLLLALVSYDPRDMPSWSFLALSESSGDTTHNFVGRVGALAAGHMLWLMGFSAYLLPFSMTWFGVCKLHSKMKITRAAWLGVAVMIISGAALLEVQNLLSERDHFTPLGGSGGLGYVIGGSLLRNLLGKVGATLVLGTVYMGGLFLVTGQHPLTVIQNIRLELTRWKAEREAQRLIQEKLAEEAANTIYGTVTPVPEGLRRKKKGAAELRGDTPAAATNMELPLKFDPPPPKIIDSSISRAHDDRSDKPKLAEVWEQKRAQKMEQAPHGSLGNLTKLFKDYKLPSMELLKWPEETNRAPTDKSELLGIQATIVRALASFGISVEPGDITRGPAITRYEVRPVDGLRVSRIANLDADIARATRAERINILAPIPGKDTVGIELANSEKTIVPLRELLEDDVFVNGKSKLPVALGKDVYGKTIIGDLAAMPHLLVAGATGSGKSVCINSIITSLICRFAPDELRFIMIDPKVVEMQNYEDLPHLALPVVTDPKKALLALRWVVKEMENRYQIFAQEGCRNFEAFNNRNVKRKAEADAARAARNAAAAAAEAAAPAVKTKAKTKAGVDDDRVSAAFAEEAAQENEEPKTAEVGTVDGDSEMRDASGTWLGDSLAPPPRRQEVVIPDTMPYIVVIVDELADLMQTAPADIEVAIARITQMARAAGIHLIVATQTPRADVITGVIKANIPTRIAFQVSSALDSRVILDRKGAENLVGKGDMLYVPPGGAQPIRSQGALVTDDEIHALVQHCVAQGKPVFDVKVDDESGEFGDDDDMGEDGVSSEEQECLEKCLEVIRQEKKASTSLLQRRLRLGYGRAARMIDILEDRGIIGPGEGAKPREILVQMD
ncbi:DNA translocase FtsK [Prosthecobacter sp.]|uniref:DNA translocase FtsK n=1 Tax=Prosthecobacter sp. TaxID=1965333 RepID=UPI00248898D2|nr:DNA translocase FtsK [Prosthecobacter sp.]MDI1311578.1 DNA translocase FtsK [Prosthecobacter sp.]